MDTSEAVQAMIKSYLTQNIVKEIQKEVKKEISNITIPRYKTAQVVSVNTDGTVNVQTKDSDVVMPNLPNRTGTILQANEWVYILAPQGNFSNGWVASIWGAVPNQIGYSGLTSSYDKTVIDGDTAEISNVGMDSLSQEVQAAIASGSGNTNYYQSTPPSGGTYNVHDLWFDTGNGNRISVWDGTQWVLTQLGGAAVTNLDAGSVTSGTMNTDRLNVSTLIQALNISADILYAKRITTSDSDIYGTIGRWISGPDTVDGLTLNLKTDDTPIFRISRYYNTAISDYVNLVEGNGKELLLTPSIVQGTSDSLNSSFRLTTNSIDCIISPDDDILKSLNGIEFNSDSTWAIGYNSLTNSIGSSIYGDSSQNIHIKSGSGDCLVCSTSGNTSINNILYAPKISTSGSSTYGTFGTDSILYTYTDANGIHHSNITANGVSVTSGSSKMFGIYNSQLDTSYEDLSWAPSTTTTIYPLNYERKFQVHTELPHSATMPKTPFVLSSFNQILPNAFTNISYTSTSETQDTSTINFTGVTGWEHLYMVINNIDGLYEQLLYGETYTVSFTFAVTTCPASGSIYVNITNTVPTSSDGNTSGAIASKQISFTNTASQNVSFSFAFPSSGNPIIDFSFGSVPDGQAYVFKISNLRIIGNGNLIDAVDTFQNPNEFKVSQSCLALNGTGSTTFSNFGLYSGMFEVNSGNFSIDHLGNVANSNGNVWDDGNCSITSWSYGNVYKFSNGTMIITMRKNIGTSNVTTTWNSIYDSLEFFVGDYPVSFTSAPVVSLYYEGNSGLQNAWNVSPRNGTSTSWPSCNLCRGSSASLANVIMDGIAIGRWQ